MNQVIKIGETPLDLDAGTVISTTKRVANIGTLERQSSFTNKLNLPATANNLAAIGMVQGSDNSTKKYIKQLGSVSANGIEIMPGAQFSFESLSERIEVLINSDNAIFYDLIKKTNLREIDLSDLDHLWTQDEMVNSINNDFTSGYIYAIHDSGFQTQFTGSCNCYGIVPSVYVKYLFQKIGENFGYTFTGNVFNESYFENLVMPAINCNVGSRNIYELQCAFIKNTSSNITPSNTWIDVPNFNLLENIDGGTFTDKWGVAPYSLSAGANYYLQIPGEYEFTLDYETTITPINPGNGTEVGLRIRCYQVLNSETTILGETIEIYNFAGPFNGQLKLNVNFDKFVETTLNPNNNGAEQTYIYCVVQAFETDFLTVRTNFQINYLNFRVSRITNAPVSHYFRFYNVQENLPNWTCAKFVKEICNLFGIIPIVNEYTKEIRLMMVNELNQNKPIAKKWQSKIDLTNEPRYTFKFEGYAQKNNLEYLPDNYLYSYQVEIANETLPKQLNYIKSEFHYSKFSRILRKDFNTIFTDNYNAEVELNSDYTYSNMLRFNNNPRIGFLFRKDTQLIYSGFGVANVIRNTNIPFLGFEAQSFQEFNLEWEYVYGSFYKSLFNGITDNILKIELEFRLTEFDIQDFDFSIPIYLENPSGFYYVQEIKDFTSSKESTSVELLRIG